METARMRLTGFFCCLLGGHLSQAVTEFGGLGKEFQPTVKASCSGGTMDVRVDTTSPFYGIIHGQSLADCSELGRGGLKTVLSIDLSSQHCGVQYDQESGDRSVVVSVRAHPSLTLLEDRVYSLSCGRAGLHTNRAKVTAVLLSVTDGYQKLNAVLEDGRYALQASVINPDPTKGLLVKNCKAFDGLGTSVELVDDRACRSEKLISEFTYRDSSGVAEATLFSVFRMPGSNRTYFQCDVEICSGPCPKPVCGGLYTGADAAGLQSVTQDSVTTATSVFVALAGAEDSLGASLCSAEGSFGSNPSWLTYLAIAFGVLLAIMLFINIFLCSAMTCSCTRTEVIEKEPSIYDDYSVYESQYGYTGKEGPYSESDLGSEYGEALADSLAGGTGSRRLPSDAGTLNSRYSHGHQQH